MRIAFLGATALVCSWALGAQTISYPQTRRVDHVDTYHGVKVADPYRWLEDDRSAETAAWVAEQNRITFGYLDRIPYRAKLRERLAQLYNYPKYGAPVRRGEQFFFTKNDGLQNQAVLYVQKGLDGTPEVLLDPNKFSADSTVLLAGWSVSKDGKYLAYATSKGGSDWHEEYVLEIATRKRLPDHLEWLKVTGISWRGGGFYYSRYPAPEKGKELSSKNENHQVWYHQVGTPQSQDELIFEDPAHPQRFHSARASEDERFVFLSVSERGQGKDGNALFYRDLTRPDTKFQPVVAEIGDVRYSPVDTTGGRILIRTNLRAPNERIVLFDPSKPAAEWKDVIPEKPEPLEDSTSTGGKLFLTYMKDVATRTYVYSLDGKLENEIALPGQGSAGFMGGRRDDPMVFYSFTSLDYPPTIFLYDIAGKKSRVFREPDVPGYNPANYTSRQVFYTSKDGTRVPMFLIHKKGLKLDGTNPALLFGYGGFNLTTNPSFQSLRLALLEQGFVYASANIRGGAEYGEKWHKGGMKLNKQNVFDDFIAAAEWLIANKYTSPAKLAVRGGSNGGLLVGAVINQRPELFGAAIPEVGVMDMLRFHKFTIGWNWIADYGSSDNAEEFRALSAYSPLHNIRSGVRYPATLVTTADHDDRVVPAHSFKYAATLQEKAAAAAHGRPLLIRVATNAGHGTSNLAKQLDREADVYAFLMENLGVTPKF